MEEWKETQLEKFPTAIGREAQGSWSGEGEEAGGQAICQTQDTSEKGRRRY